MIWNLYLSVRSDPVKGGAVFFENWLQLLFNSFRLRRTCIFWSDLTPVKRGVGIYFFERRF